MLYNCILKAKSNFKLYSNQFFSELNQLDKKTYFDNMKNVFVHRIIKPADHCSCIAHLSAEDMLNSNKFRNTWVLSAVSAVQKDQETNLTLS